MSIAYWCVLFAALMPILWTAIAKLSVARFDNRTPRAWQAQLSGLPLRAHSAHLNSFEAFPPFAAAVIIAHQLTAPQAMLDHLAIAFIGLRLLYGALYLADLHLLRSVVWALGLAATVAIFLLAAGYFR